MQRSVLLMFGAVERSYQDYWARSKGCFRNCKISLTVMYPVPRSKDCQAVTSQRGPETAGTSHKPSHGKVGDLQYKRGGKGNILHLSTSMSKVLKRAETLLVSRSSLHTPGTVLFNRCGIASVLSP